MNTDQITFTRFIAALSVIYFHYSPQHFGLLDDLIKAGPIAVNYFFSLSGFILAIAYITPSPSNSNTSPLKAKPFYIARFARIYPLYILALIPVVLANTQKIELPSLGLTATLLQAWIPGSCPNSIHWQECPLAYNSPGWSLSVEFFFYACFPLIAGLIYRFSLSKMLYIGLAIWLATQLVHTGLLNSESYSAKNTVHDFIYYHPLMHINSFVLGIIVGVFIKKKQHQHTTKIPLFNAYALFGILAISATISALIIYKPNINTLLGFNIDYTNGLIAPLFLLIIVLLTLHQGLVTRLFRLKTLILLGEASFAMYILQRPVYGIYSKLIASHIELSDTIHFYLYLALLIAISIISFLLIETPARKAIKKLTN